MVMSPVECQSCHIFWQLLLYINLDFLEYNEKYLIIIYKIVLIVGGNIYFVAFARGGWFPKFRGEMLYGKKY